MSEKNYKKPVLEITVMSCEDVLSGSDVLIDAKDFFEPESNESN